MKRRLIAAFAALMTLCLVLVGCGGATSSASAGSNLVGVWELDSMESAGESVSSDDLALMRSFGLNVFVVVNDDGTFTINLYGEELPGTWSASDANNATLSFSGSEATTEIGENAKMSYANDKLTLTTENDDEQASMTFAKTTKEAMDEFLAESDSDDDEDDDATPLNVSVTDDDVLSFELVSIRDDSDGDPNINMTVTNKTDHDLHITGVEGSWTVGGTAVDPVISTYVSAGETDDDFMYFSQDEVDGIANLKDVKGSFEVRDDDDNVVATYEVSF